MNLVTKEYHKKARLLLEGWQSREDNSDPLEQPSLPELVSVTDLALLDQDASISAVNKLCKHALEYQFASVCVNPIHVERCVNLLNQELPVTTVIGFPLGASHPQIRVAETTLALQQGAREFELVLNTGLLKTANYQEVFEDLRNVRHACAAGNLRIILETDLLSPLDIIIACMLCREAGADDVMTSTGFCGSGATPENVSLMCHVLGSDLGVKASGGISSREDVSVLLRAGASRFALDFPLSPDLLEALNPKL